ncbi:MAG: hypothetical protein ABJH98_05280 [Reichenbachiella sp.]|uniref:hypothetical protein n=1 Tax=Reichenbachiella sp. TaxID=2184521 RepID=UPI003296FB09
MNKILTLLTVIIFTNTAFAQHNIVPDTLTRIYGVKYVLLTNEKETPFYKYSFDAEGRNYKNEGLDSLGRVRGRVLFSYTNERLDTLTRYSTYGFDPYAWDSTSLTYKITYQVQDDKVSRLSWLDDGDFLSMQIDYSYDQQNRIIREEVREFEQPGVISFSAFEPNSANFKDSITEMGNSVREKLYKYEQENCSISYYINGRLTGMETQIFDRNNNIIKRTISNVNGEPLLTEKFKYDSQNREIERTITQTGYDGYGYSYDFVCYDRYTTQYFEDGRIKSTINYCGDEYKSMVKYNWIK